MSEPEPTIIWLSKDDFSRLKEDLHELFEGDSRKGCGSCFYPENPWKDVICDDGRTVQLKLEATWRRREGWVFLRQLLGKGRAASQYCHGKLCGCTVLPEGE